MCRGSQNSCWRARYRRSKMQCFVPGQEIRFKDRESARVIRPHEVTWKVPSGDGLARRTRILVHGSTTELPLLLYVVAAILGLLHSGLCRESGHVEVCLEHWQESDRNSGLASCQFTANPTSEGIIAPARPEESNRLLRAEMVTTHSNHGP
ncbi:hypothetical protein BJX61DRAFT_174353 [Aspergillus egyptiacus]|nr:hypothetical protein BJX61DRAFT_174353 [Aspergillus egyptiacus]